MVDPSSETGVSASVAVLVIGSGGAASAGAGVTAIVNVVTREQLAAASSAARVPNPSSKTDLRSRGARPECMIAEKRPHVSGFDKIGSGVLVAQGTCVPIDAPTSKVVTCQRVTAAR
ncbi:hypothetical protein NSK11_contig00021-0015 [Nocardia seriolae]|uniref:Uncharacterized protein n=1 Tax=Nocardia seriolae TaxID=37332 RepID=A0ABC9YQ94_9NOCA|nr:hypothetical protein NSERKGN1266_29660 [Nocardia seriolae]BEK97208.1 hypothetical protein NSER024013_51140 [Nocardia seriolae]GAM45568.1 hypothetical protein NS07_v2contig00017-0015 [Nocardia seriolae]GAP27592.1 hypothetical protein NSK11_contig00021-0015 [Nocardia seriolae]GEM22672.1 hypothetical protein NS2_09110 [Nocardia seriolae NBRC 15557]